MTNAERMVPYYFKKILLLAHCRRDDHSAQPLRAWRGPSYVAFMPDVHNPKKVYNLSRAE